MRMALRASRGQVARMGNVAGALRRRCGLKAIVGLLASVVVPALGGCQPDFTRVWIILEIRDAETGDVISGATVRIPSLQLQVELDLSDFTPIETLMAPTDSLGRTWVPAALLGIPPVARDLDVTVQYEDVEEVLVLQSVTGNTVRGDRFQCTVLDIGSTGPRIREPEIVQGSSPPTIRFDSYVNGVFVRSTNCFNPIRAITATTFRPHYLSEYVFDVDPHGFLEHVSEEICTKDPAQAEQFWLETHFDFDQIDATVSEFFCVDESNTVVPCG